METYSPLGKGQLFVKTTVAAGKKTLSGIIITFDGWKKRRSRYKVILLLFSKSCKKAKIST